MDITIGLLGEQGSGKSTFIQLLQECMPEEEIGCVRSSDILAESLNALGIPRSRKNYTKHVLMIEKEYGRGTLAEEVYRRLIKLPTKKRVWDGVRWTQDVRVIRRFSDSLLVYVTADVKTRYRRVKDRKDKFGEEYLTFDEFEAEEQSPTEKDIPIIGAKADLPPIENDSSLETYRQKVIEFYIRYLK